MYLRTDAEKEVLETLCMSSRFADDLKRDNYFWRWVIIALHSAVQGYMVLAFRNKNTYAIYDKKSTKALYKANSAGVPPPADLKLDTYLNLYKKAKKQLGYTPAGTEGKNIKRLNEFRNEFIHFTPQGWSLQVDGLPRICIDCLKFIEFLDGKTFWHDPNYHERSQLCCYKFNEQMNELEQAYRKIQDG